MTDIRVVILKNADIDATAFVRANDNIMVLGYNRFLSYLASPHLSTISIVEITHSVAEENNDSWDLVWAWENLMNEPFTDEALKSFDRLFNFGVVEDFDWEKWD